MLAESSTHLFIPELDERGAFNKPLLVCNLNHFVQTIQWKLNVNGERRHLKKL